MTPERLFEMHKLLEAKFHAEQQAFQRLVTREGKIRAELRKLAEQAHDMQASEDTNMRAIGADVIWLGWISRTRRVLNMELAQIQALKENYIDQVKRAFGRMHVAKTLAEQALTEARTTKVKAERDAAVQTWMTLNL